MATAGKLRETIAEYKNDEALVWQFYDGSHAGIPEWHFKEVAKALQDYEPYLEELHELTSNWMQATYKRLVSDGTVQLSYAELPGSHAEQVEFFEWCSCEDGPKVYEDCTQDGKL
jgi:hypothetical protein